MLLEEILVAIVQRVKWQIMERSMRYDDEFGVWSYLFCQWSQQIVIKLTENLLGVMGERGQTIRGAA